MIEDKAIDFYRHFWLTIPDRRDYGNPENWKGASPRYLNDPRRPRPADRRGLPASAQQRGARASTRTPRTACAYTADGFRTDAVRDRPLEAAPRRRPTSPTTSGCAAHRARAATATCPWRCAGRGTGFRAPGGLPTREQRILIHSRTAVGVPDLDSLMWRNVYNIGKVAKADRDQFRMRVVDKDSLEKRSGDSLTYLQRLGLERAGRPGQIDFDNPDIFNFDQGYLVLPCRGGVSDADDAQNCLTPIARVSPSTEIYTRNVDEVLSGSTFTRFIVTGKQRKSSFDVRETSHSVSGSQCLDITPGTEKVVRNGSEVLQKNVDYEVLYETGQITLTSPRARDPNADIKVSYECNPPFQIQDKILLGTRLEYKLDGISDESILGATLLYKSQTTTSERPELGREPFNQFLWGFNARLVGAPKWMTRVANLFPFVATEAPSKAAFDFEVAQSRYNPNTKSSAYLDNFEGSESILSMPTSHFNWYKASPPQFDSTGKPDETLDFRHQGKFWWHCQPAGALLPHLREDRQPRDRLPRAGAPQAHPRAQRQPGGPVLGRRDARALARPLQPEPQAHPRGGGAGPGRAPQRGPGPDVRGHQHPGNRDGEPDGTLQSEIQVGRETVNDKDLRAGRQGRRPRDGRPLGMPADLLRHPRRDLGRRPRPGQLARGQPGRHRGGPPGERDRGEQQETQGFGYDTEDLDRSGVLDTRNLHLRYSISLDDDCSAANHCEELVNNWRKYRIPLYGSGARIGASAGESEAQILSSVKLVRVWLGSLPPRVARAQVMLARLNLIGNAWEEGERNRDFEIDSDRFSTGDLRDSAAIRVPPSTPDSNRLRVDVIINQEEKAYKASPRTKTELDTRTDEPLPERSLVMRYENLHPGEAVHATRLLGSDPKDLTQYDRILLEVHPDSSSTAAPRLLPAGPEPRQPGAPAGQGPGQPREPRFYEVRLHMDTSDKASSIPGTARSGTATPSR